MADTEEVMNTHATNLRDEQAATGVGLAPGVWEFIKNTLAREEEDDTLCILEAYVDGVREGLCTDALTEREAASFLLELEAKLNNPDVRAVIIGDHLIPVDRLLSVSVEAYWAGDEEEGD